MHSTNTCAGLGLRDSFFNSDRFKATSWSTILYALISATIQQIITNFSAVVTKCQMKAKLKISAHVPLGNYVNQVHHTTNTRESRESKNKN